MPPIYGLLVKSTTGTGDDTSTLMHIRVRNRPDVGGEPRVEQRWRGGGGSPANPPASGLSVSLLRIDCIFYTPDLAAIRSRVARNQGSEHRAIVADLATR